MDTQKAQIVDRLKQANNILVTVSANPSLDQLASMIGITLLLNKLGKHATAVFSGTVPSVLEFLEPSKTIETNTDSLRDFIISLDKNKADKLRYKVEDDNVRIFITPYRTSITEKDLVFSQGDFNVEAVLAIGISKQQDLDKAITAYGRILHDATVMNVSTEKIDGLGTINLINPKASSLSEILVDIGIALKPDTLDSQMATAFLTGIVVQTNRFSNEKTTSETMEISSRLLAAGANQQLVATKLQPPKPPTPPPAPQPIALTPAPAPTPASVPVAPAAAAAAISLPEPVAANQVASDGSLQIDHGPVVDLDTYELSGEADETEKLEQIHIDDQGHLKAVQPEEEVKPATSPQRQRLVQPISETPPLAATESGPLKLQPPTTGGTLTASGVDDEQEPAINPLADVNPGGATSPLLSRQAHSPTPPAALPQPGDQPIQDSHTLADLERAVQSQQPADDVTSQPSIASAPPIPNANIDEARSAVDSAVSASSNRPLPPIKALGAQYVDLPGVGGTPQPPQSEAVAQSVPAAPAAEAPVGAVDPTAPPPVPPPMMPPAFTPSA